MVKRILSALVLSALLLATLAACGNQPDETTPVATTPAATTPSDTTPVETTPAQTEPPATTPAVTEPLATTPAVTEPPATTPAQTEPPATAPAETQPAATTPPYLSPFDKAIKWYGGQDLPPLGESPYSEETLAEWGLDFRIIKYLGTYNGYSIYVEKSPLRFEEHMEIGGVAFCWLECNVFAVKDGETVILDEAYKRGIVDQEDLLAIAYYWYGDSFPCDDD